jgi:hypothetical protein
MITESQAHYELIKASESLARIASQFANQFRSFHPDSESSMALIRATERVTEAEKVYWAIIDGR